MWFEHRSIPRWLGGALHLFLLPLVHAGAPWLLSSFAVRRGWVDGSPGVYNYAGLIPVAMGFGLIFWCMLGHFQAAPHGWVVERTPHYPTPAVLLMKGPYRFSRNPIYLAEGVLWMGWMVFYGSASLLAVFAALALTVGPLVVRREERGLEAKFGDAWRAYAIATPRWIGIRSIHT